MTDYMDELTLQVLAVSKQLKAAVDALTTAGHTAHNAGDTDMQHYLEQVTHIVASYEARLFSEYAMRMLEKSEGIK